MAIRSQLTFYGTGKPMKSGYSPRIDRAPGWKGVVQSGSKSAREMGQIIRQKTDLQPKSLGQGAVKLQKSSGISINITI